MITTIHTTWPVSLCKKYSQSISNKLHQNDIQYFALLNPCNNLKLNKTACLRHVLTTMQYGIIKPNISSLNKTLTHLKTIINLLIAQCHSFLVLRKIVIKQSG
jgi:hypothetical protein